MGSHVESFELRATRQLTSEQNFWKEGSKTVGGRRSHEPRGLGIHGQAYMEGRVLVEPSRRRPYVLPVSILARGPEFAVEGSLNTP